jgi:hypothetical protein
MNPSHRRTLLLLSLLLPAPALGARSGAEVYRQACASCHASDGRGAPKHVTGLETPLPDFTDCSFVTREPDPDWYAVAHDGGSARAFAKTMPAFGGALGEAELKASLDHIRAFCPSMHWPRGDLNLPRPLFTEKAFPEDEAVLSTRIATRGQGEVMSKLVFEKRLFARGQLEVIVPFGFRDLGEKGWTAGLGDLGLGTKWVLLHSLRAGSILSLTGEVILPTGRKDRGYGKGTTVFEPFLSFGQVLPADSFLQLQVGAELPAERSVAEPELFWRGVLGITLTQGRFGRSWSPMVEVLGARELEEGKAIAWDLVPQLQVSLSKRQHVLLAAGVQIPLNETAARKPQVLFYLLWDWFDGELFGSGW